MTDKKASSQAAWALLVEGVAHARVDSHRIRHLITRALELIESSEDKEHLYQVAGDIIVGLPARLDHLDIALDRTGLALSKMGQDFLESRLPLSEKTMVDEAVSAAFGRPVHKDSSVDRIADRYVQKMASVGETDISGQTFQFKELIKEHGGKWDGLEKFWKVPTPFQSWMLELDGCFLFEFYKGKSRMIMTHAWKVQNGTLKAYPLTLSVFGFGKKTHWVVTMLPHGTARPLKQQVEDEMQELDERIQEAKTDQIRENLQRWVEQLEEILELAKRHP